MTEIKNQLTSKEINLLQSVVSQVCGYPIDERETKIGISEDMLNIIYNKVHEIKEGRNNLLDDRTFNDHQVIDGYHYLSNSEKTMIMWIFAIFFREIPVWECQTITGYEKFEFADLYARLIRKSPAES